MPGSALPARRTTDQSPRGIRPIPEGDPGLSPLSLRARRQHTVHRCPDLIKLTEVFDVTLDYLAFEDRDKARNGGQIVDRELLEKVQLVDKLLEGDKDAVKAVLDSFILKNRFQRLAVGEAGSTS